MTDFQTILAIDTAMNGCGVGLRVSDGRVFAEVQTMGRGQSEVLVPMIGRVLQQAGKKYDGIDAVVTTIGPGAFTGMRIGLSTAKSLALALDIPVFGITTLQVLALQYAQDKNPDTQIIVLVDTKREDFYVQIFAASGTAMSEPRAIPAEDVALLGFDKHVIFIGDGVTRFKGLIEASEKWVFEESYLLASPAVMTNVLAEQGAESPLLHRQVNPVYLRPPDVSVSKKPQRAIL